MVRLNHRFAQAFRSGGLRFGESFRAELRFLDFMRTGIFKDELPMSSQRHR